MPTMDRSNPRRELQLPALPPLRSEIPPPPPPLRQHHSTPNSPEIDHLIRRFQAFVPREHTPGRGSCPRPPSPQYPPQAYSQGYALYHHTQISPQTSPRFSQNRLPPPPLRPLQHSPQPSQPTQQAHHHYWHPNLPAINRNAPMRFPSQPQTSPALHPQPLTSSYYSPPRRHPQEGADERFITATSFGSSDRDVETAAAILTRMSASRHDTPLDWEEQDDKES